MKFLILRKKKHFFNFTDFFHCNGFSGLRKKHLSNVFSFFFLPTVSNFNCIENILSIYLFKFFHSPNVFVCWCFILVPCVCVCVCLNFGSRIELMEQNERCAWPGKGFFWGNAFWLALAFATWNLMMIFAWPCVCMCWSGLNYLLFNHFSTTIGYVLIFLPTFDWIRLLL